MLSNEHWGHLACLAQHFYIIGAAYFVFSQFGTGLFMCMGLPEETLDFDHFIFQCHNLVSGVYKTSCRTGRSFHIIL